MNDEGSLMKNIPDRGSAEDQERWIAELDAVERAEDFPPGGSLILAESPEHAQSIVDELRAEGHRSLACGVYVRTTHVFRRHPRRTRKRRIAS